MLAPLTFESLMEALKRREVRHFLAADADRFRALVSWELLEDAFRREVVPQADLRVIRDSKPVPAAFYSNGDVVSADRLLGILKQGVSAVIVPIDEPLPTLGALSAALRERIAERIWTGVIVTTGAGGAFIKHYDAEDLLILQVEGTKRWLIDDAPVDHPVPWMPQPTAPEGVPVFDRVLQPGEMLLVPAGYWHRCENGPQRSIHVGVFFEAPTLAHVARVLARRLADDVELRRPLSRMDAVLDETQIRAQLLARIAELPLTDVMATLRSRGASRRPQY